MLQSRLHDAWKNYDRKAETKKSEKGTVNDKRKGDRTQE